MAGAPMLLKLNEHVRVDVIYGSRSPRTKAWIDALGFLLVLLPVCGIVVALSGHFVLDSFHQQEHSPSAGGLLRWPIKAAIPVGFALLALQGVPLAEAVQLYGLGVQGFFIDQPDVGVAARALFLDGDGER